MSAREKSKKAVTVMEQIYFGQRIARLRREQGMTQEMLAQKLGITNQAVSKWESDQCCPDIMQLPQLAELFGISLDALFGREAAAVPEVRPGDLPWADDNSLRAVCYLGHRLLEEKELSGYNSTLEKVQLNFEGTVENVKSVFSVSCPGASIGGDVKAGDSVSCGDVRGDVKAGDSVTCGNVSGNASAGDSLTCGSVGGNAKAGDSLECSGDIGGSASAGGDLHCGAVGGAVRAQGNIYCTKA